MFKTSSSSSSSLVVILLIAILGLLASAPSPASAGCTLECTALSAKIAVCGSVFRDGITDELPRIGVDVKRDDCLCKQDIIQDINSCYICKNPATVSNVTNQFINDCKVLSNKNLVNAASPVAKGATVGILALVAMVASVFLV